MTTSGTVSTTVFNVGKFIDRAFGLCKLAPQQITGEYIEIAKDWLFLYLSSLCSEALPLWVQTKVIVPIYASTQDAPLDTSVIDVLNANLRTSTRLTGSYTSSEGIAANAFDGDLLTACTQTTPGGNITANLGALFSPPTWGFFANASGIWDFSFQTSLDGITWKTVYSASGQVVTEGEWFWVDIEGIRQTSVRWVRILAGGTTVLDIAEFVVQDSPNEIPIAKLNRDDYANLPDKWFVGRPVQFWYNKQIPNPVMTVWPAPEFQYTFNQYVLYVSRYVQDVGELTDTLEVPQRWYLAILYKLALHLSMSIPEVDPSRMAFLQPVSEDEYKKAQGSESDGAPTYLRPRIWNYTR